MKNVFVDIETYSGANLVTQGLHKYVENEEFDVLLVAYAIDDEEPVVFEPGECSEVEKEFNRLCFMAGRGPEDITLWAFNAQFERTCLNGYLNTVCKTVNPPNPPLRSKGGMAETNLSTPKWKDVQARAIYNGLPNSLDNCCKVLGVPTKNADGGKLVNLFCVKKEPNRTNGFRERLTKKDLPSEWEKFKEYVLQDVRCEREVWRRTVPLPEKEEIIWNVDQTINDRGVPVDLDFVSGAIVVDERAESTLKDYLVEATGLENPNSKTQMKRYIEEKTGEKIESLDKSAIKTLTETTKDQDLSQILKLQAQISMSSTAKYKVIKECVCKDKRVRGLLKYYGANTGRWSGKLVQLQNLPNDSIEDTDTARDLIKDCDFEMLDLLFGNPKRCLSALIRSSFIASPCHTLIVADYSAIEARVIAWLAGETWRQEVFATHGKIYEASASQMFNVPVDQVTKDQRKKGKIAELALGYGGGVSALKAFGADKLGLSDNELSSIVKSWREKSPHIVDLWKKIERTAFSVVETGRSGVVKNLCLGLVSPPLIPPDAVGGRTYIKSQTLEAETVNPPTPLYNLRGADCSEPLCSKGGMAESETLRKGGITNINPQHLTITLPSGRDLFYRDVFFDGDKLAYKCRSSMGANGYGTSRTYGGKLVENIIQSIARDLLANALVNLEKANFKVLFHVHDEIIAEVPTEDAEGKLQEMMDIMCDLPAWAEGLYLKAAGFISPYYKKD